MAYNPAFFEHNEDTDHRVQVNLQQDVPLIHEVENSSLKMRVELVSGAVSPGTLVCGTLELHVKKNISCKAVRMRFNGVETVTPARFDNIQSTSKKNQICRPQFDAYVTMWGKEEKNERKEKLKRGEKYNIVQKELVADVYTFPFSYRLPMEVVPTFDDGVGSVQYFATAILDMPWYKSNKTLAMPFAVTPPGVSYREFQAAQASPKANMEEKTISFWCLPRGKVTANLMMPEVVVVNQPDVQLKLKVDNDSSFTIKYVGARIVMQNSYSLGKKKKGVLSRESAVYDRPLGEAGLQVNDHDRDFTALATLNLKDMGISQPSFRSPCISRSYTLQLRLGRKRDKSRHDLMIAVPFRVASHISFGNDDGGGDGDGGVADRPQVPALAPISSQIYAADFMAWDNNEVRSVYPQLPASNKDVASAPPLSADSQVNVNDLPFRDDPIPVDNAPPIRNSYTPVVEVEDEEEEENQPAEPVAFGEYQPVDNVKVAAYVPAVASGGINWGSGETNSLGVNHLGEKDNRVRGVSAPPPQQQQQQQPPLNAYVPAVDSHAQVAGILANAPAPPSHIPAIVVGEADDAPGERQGETAPSAPRVVLA